MGTRSGNASCSDPSNNHHDKISAWTYRNPSLRRSRTTRRPGCCNEGALYNRCRLWSTRQFDAGVPSHHSTEDNPNALGDGEVDGTPDCVVAHGSRSAWNCDCSTGHETAKDGIPEVFFLPASASTPALLADGDENRFLARDSIDSAVEHGEESASESKVPTQDWCSSVPSRESADASLAMRSTTARTSARSLPLPISKTYRKPLMPCHTAPPMACEALVPAVT
jgi:hypothetical protein